MKIDQETRELGRQVVEEAIQLREENAKLRALNGRMAQTIEKLLADLATWEKTAQRIAEAESFTPSDIEHVARAISNEDLGTDESWPHYAKMARAALESTRIHERI